MILAIVNVYLFTYTNFLTEIFILCILFVLQRIWNADTDLVDIYLEMQIWMYNI